MNKNVALLSIGAALFFSLGVVDLGHAVQPQKGQAAPMLMAGEVNGTATASTTQVSTTPIPGGGWTGSTCRTQSQPGSGAPATEGSLYISQVSTTPIPCGGRTAGATCRTQSPQVSDATATDGFLNTTASMLVPLSAVGILFGAGFLGLVGLGASRLRHHHGHHA